jgi:predicted outer membrane protein
MKSKSNPSSSVRSAGANSESEMAASVKDDAEFLRSAYEGGLAEIALARLAAEKASSEKVKDYAQQMIKEHTMGNQMIAALITGNGGTEQMAGSPTGTAGSSMGAGSGTAAGTGTGSAGGTDGGTSGSATGSGTGTSGSAGATGSSSGAAGNAGASGTGSAGTAATAGTDAAGVAGNAGMNASGTVSAEVKAREAYIFSTELKPEHKALEARLSKLSGAAFDRQYAQAMVKDHTKMVKMVEAKANEADGVDQPSAAQAWAKQHLPIMQQHLKKAEKLAQSTGSSKNKNKK